MVTPLKDKVAVVTGASSGIGRAITEGLAAFNTSLCIIGRNLRTLETVASACGASSLCKAYEADLASEEEIRRTAEIINSDVGQIDILIHSAGVFSMGSIEEGSAEQFDRQYRINVLAPYLLTQTLLPAIRSCRGQVVFINSSAGLKGRARIGQYAATKHALKAIADSLREEVNADGVRILSIYPGRTATPMQALVHKIEGKAYVPDRLLRPEDIASIVINALSLPRSAEVTDIHIRPFNKFE